MKQSLFHPELIEGLIACSGTSHTNILADLGDWKYRIFITAMQLNTFAHFKFYTFLLSHPYSLPFFKMPWSSTTKAHCPRREGLNRPGVRSLKYNGIRWDNRKFIYIIHQKGFQRLPLSHYVFYRDCDNQTISLFPEAAFFQGRSKAPRSMHPVARLTWVRWLNRLYDAQYYWYESNPEGIKCL